MNFMLNLNLNILKVHLRFYLVVNKTNFHLMKDVEFRMLKLQFITALINVILAILKIHFNVKVVLMK